MEMCLSTCLWEGAAGLVRCVQQQETGDVECAQAHMALWYSKMKIYQLFAGFHPGY